MRRLKRRIETGQKKKQDTPQKTSFSKRMGVKKRTRTTIFETVPENTEVNFPPVQKVLAKQGELDTGADGSEESSPLSLVIDTSCSSESTVFDTSNSFPSPEVFREEHYEDQFTFCLEDELTDLHFPIKNSTLLEQSRAENILTYHPPNLSTIIDASTILAENGNQDINRDLSANKNPSDGCKLIPAPTSDQARKPSFVLIKKTTFLKKRVQFRNPLFAEKSRRESMGTPPQKIQCHKIIPRQATPTKSTETETLQGDEDDDVDGGTFFDFPCDSERDRYIWKMRERYIKLKKAPVFPLTAVSTKKSAL